MRKKKIEDWPGPTPNAERRTPNAEDKAFTLIELIVVIAIIAVLIGFAFPAFQGVIDRAKKVQAKNDVTQIVTAVSAFYTEYGKYPTNSTTDVTFGTGLTTNDQLVDILRNNTSNSNVTSFNPRQIVFVEVAPAKDQTTPRSGIKTSSGVWYDPWGSPYFAAVDANYNGITKAPAYTDINSSYSTSSDGSDTGIRTGVLAWSLGKNGALGGGAAASSAFAKETGSAGKYTNSGDVISWQ
jgi:prepilin-type N-terminal cleavage/methylation domain-containing protein